MTQRNDSIGRRQFLMTTGAVAAGMCLPLARGEDATPRKTNVLIFLADDHSTFDTGCYGNKVVKTPNIDRLASEGMRFDRAFTATAMCAPARSMLYTGLYSHRNGCHMNHGATKTGIKSIPHYLKPRDYRVVLAGKQHIKPRSVYPFEYLEENDVEKVIAGNDPFCLVLASSEPHAPHQHGGYRPQDVPLPPYLPDTPAFRSNQEGYYTDITTMDKQLGDALKLLREHHKEENTLVIYAADHGDGLMAKWTCYEAGLRVPFIARWPGRIAAGSSTNAMVNFVDVLPTLLDITGAKPADDLDGKSMLPVLTGTTDTHRSLMYGAHTNQGIISGEPYPVRSVRDDRYKYIRNLMPNGQATNVNTHGMNHVELKDGPWAEWKALAATDADAARLIRRVLHRPAEELYDLDKDPWELHNLAAEQQLAQIKARLSRELDQWMLQQVDGGAKAELQATPHPSMRPSTGKVGSE